MVLWFRTVGCWSVLIFPRKSDLYWGSVYQDNLLYTVATMQSYTRELFRTTASKLFSTHPLSLLQSPNCHRCGNQNTRKDTQRDKPFVVLWSVHLLPNHLRQPRLENIRHFVHAANNQRSFLIIRRADFMRPAW